MKYASAVMSVVAFVLLTGLAAQAPCALPQQPTGRGTAAAPARATAAPAGSAASAVPARTRPLTPPPVTPQVATLPVLPPQPTDPNHLLVTPRARLTLCPRVSDPRDLVEASGRSGCVFSFRTISAGIVEYLFPGFGLFRRSDPLFRLYDPEILTDLSTVEQALRDYDVEPLLIAAATPRRPVPRGLVPRGEPIAAPAADFPSPFAASRVPPLARSASPTVPAREAVAPTPPRPAAPQRPRVAQPQPPVRRASPPSPGRLKRVVPEASEAGLKAFEEAAAEARAALQAAEAQVQECQEDYEAKQRLVDLGALAQKTLEASAAQLAEAKRALADARARVEVATDRLAAERARAAQAQGASRTVVVGEDEAQDVEVLRGPQRSAEALDVEVARGSGGAEASYVGEPHDFPAPVQRPATTPRRIAGGNPAGTATPARGGTAPAGTTAPAVAAAPRPPRRPTVELDYRGATPPLISRSFPQKPRELDRLAEPRYTDYRAPADGFVLACTAANGSTVAAGQEVLRVINTQWARVYFRVEAEDAERFEPGTVVQVTFDDYPDVLFEGWINSVTAERGGEALRAEVIVFCRKGYYGTDAFATLEWLALATPLEDDLRQVEPVEAVVEDSPEQHYHRDPKAVLSLVPRDVWALSVPPEALKRSEHIYQGQLQLAELCTAQGNSSLSQAQLQRLEALKRWRQGFVEGMTRTIFGDGVVLTYPRDGEIRRAIERMATGQVTNIPNRCARTVREALGWGLGDAHVWAQQLPSRGYVARADGLARPGDILVWPFTFPPRGSQHIGIAVQQNGKLMLLSNLNGRLGTSEIQPGYLAFYKK